MILTRKAKLYVLMANEALSAGAYILLCTSELDIGKNGVFIPLHFLLKHALVMVMFLLVDIL